MLLTDVNKSKLFFLSVRWDQKVVVTHISYKIFNEMFIYKWFLNSPFRTAYSLSLSIFLRFVTMQKKKNFKTCIWQKTKNTFYC